MTVSVPVRRNYLQSCTVNGRIRSVPARVKKKPRGRHGFDHRKPVCLARQTSGSFHARMLIKTSIRSLMSAN